MLSKNGVATTPSSTETLKIEEPVTPHQAENVEEEKLLLSQENGRQLVEALEIPELEVEIERAIFQVEAALNKAKTESSPEANKTKKDE